MMQKSRAKGLGRVFAIAAVVALASIALAVVYAPKAGSFSWTPPEPAPVTGGGGEVRTVAHETVRYDGVITSLQAFGNAPRVAVDPKPEDDEPKKGPTGRDIKYLGAITRGEDLVALVRIDGKQRFWRVGQDYEGITVEQIELDKIIVDENGLKRQATLAKRTGPVVTKTDGPAAATPAPLNGQDATRAPTQEERQTELQRRRDELMRQREEALKRARERGSDIDD
ncbi:MAG: hypothetical protein KDA28_15250 [Phycisphaerales bacterium]|nr:hypothetical protein [Phycisphaerales bacterium]